MYYVVFGFQCQAKYGDYDKDTHKGGFLANDRLVPLRYSKMFNPFISSFPCSLTRNNITSHSEVLDFSLLTQMNDYHTLYPTKATPHYTVNLWSPKTTPHYTVNLWSPKTTPHYTVNLWSPKTTPHYTDTCISNLHQAASYQSPKTTPHYTDTCISNLHPAASYQSHKTTPHSIISNLHQAASYQSPKTTPHSISNLQPVIKATKLHLTLYPTSIKQPVIKVPKLLPTLYPTSNLYQAASYLFSSQSCWTTQAVQGAMGR